ncbi:MAG: hypothetical protein FWD70_00815 [Desulfuromonadales bacterium]|nr:hypothetical protein [Desulfuromonadales bacterium]
MHKYKIAAVIDIGSSVVRMHISQWDGKMVMTLDKLEKPTQIGKEVFSTGYISFNTVRSLSTILSGFCKKAQEYGVTIVHAIASTAMREASNRAYVLDHILTHNKLEVHVLEDAEGSALIINAMKNSGYTLTKKMLLVYGGTGTTDFELLKNGKIALTHSIQTGFLKISEMLREAADVFKHTDYMAEEYLNMFLMRENRIKDLWEADGILLGAGDLQPLYKLCKVKFEDGVISIPAKTLLDIYESYRLLSIERICKLHNIDIQQGGILYAMLTLIAALLRFTKVKKLFCVQLSIADAMMNLLLRPGARKGHDENLRTGAVISALDLAVRYRCDMNHCSYITDIALSLFEKLRKVFGFSKRQNLLLHIACILHGSGYYTNSSDIQEAAFNLVKDAHIYGLCSRETLLAANIIAPQSLLGVTRNALNKGTLASDDVLFAAKMHAILRLANDMDCSHKQKAKLHDLILEDDSLTISVKIQEDFTLEQWIFRESASLFQEIFGITPQLKINNIYQQEGKNK